VGSGDTGEGGVTYWTLKICNGAGPYNLSGEGGKRRNGEKDVLLFTESITLSPFNYSPFLLIVFFCTWVVTKIDNK
jgi:hypothetical protein